MPTSRGVQYAIGFLILGSSAWMFIYSTLLSLHSDHEEVGHLRETLSVTLRRLDAMEAEVKKLHSSSSNSQQYSSASAIGQVSQRSQVSVKAQGRVAPAPAPVCPVGDRHGMMLHPNRTMAADAHSYEGQDAFFERLLTSPGFQKYSPSVLSRKPWILQFDTFLSPQECQHLLQSVPEWRPDVVAKTGRNLKNRNSSSWNCDYSAQCAEKPAIKNYRSRLQALGIKEKHSEGISILKYEPGGFYKKHHDYIFASENCGPRVLTVMTYLADVEAGGATSFFHLGVDVRPKAGRLIVWANTFPDRPLEKMESTAHEALVVHKGTKFTLTSWYEQYDRAGNLAAHCCPA